MGPNISMASWSVEYSHWPQSFYLSCRTDHGGQNEEFVAFESDSRGNWCHIYLPNAGGPASGWVAGSIAGPLIPFLIQAATLIEAYNGNFRSADPTQRRTDHPAYCKHTTRRKI